MKDYISYEQPINKRLRAMMRLDLLFDQVTYFSKAKNVWDNTSAVNVINDILEFTNRTDIKTEVIKELERQQNHISSLLTQPGVNEKKSLKLIENLKELSDQLHGFNGAIGQSLQNNAILNASKQKSILPGSCGNFDSPLYIQWINQTAATRSEQLLNWISIFLPLNNAIKLVLKIIRESGEICKLTAENGFFQDNLDPAKPYQLIQVFVPCNQSYYPEISAGKHRFSIRFLENSDFTSNPEQVTSDVEFILSNCCF